MWNRKEIKEKGKAAFKANYWRCVLVAFILTLIAGAGAGAGAGTGAANVRDEIKDNQQNEIYDDYDDDIEEFDMDEFLENNPDFDMDQFLEDNPDIDLDMEGTSAMQTVAVPSGIGEGLMTGGIIIFAVIILLLALAASLAISWLVLNPLRLGCAKFFYSNTEKPADVGEVGFGFSNKYGGFVKAMMLRDIYSILWTFLFIIPGIIKGGYSYRLVPYILMDNPDIGAKEAVTKSRDMMNGHKWKTFVYDLSFLGWTILSILTLGILSIFYVSPYKKSSDAELYKAIRDGNSGYSPYAPQYADEDTTADVNIQPVVETAVETDANNTVDVL